MKYFPVLAGQSFMATHSSLKMSKPSLDEMWALIGKILLPYDDMPDKTRFNEEQVFELYSMIKEADELFRMLAQITVLKNAIDDLMK